MSISAARASLAATSSGVGSSGWLAAGLGGGATGWVWGACRVEHPDATLNSSEKSKQMTKNRLITGIGLRGKDPNQLDWRQEPVSYFYP